MTMVVWKFVGFQVIVLLVGLQSIPDQLYEAARMDGANTWHRLRYITVPYMRPTFALLLVLSITGSLLSFDQFLVLTRGGPDNSTVTLVFAIYNSAFQGFDLGKAAALGCGPGGAGHAERGATATTESQGRRSEPDPHVRDSAQR